MRFYKDAPDEGEFVVVEIEDIHEHSASAHIEGYDANGLIHISEVSRSWVRDIRQEISEGEKTVAQVIEIEDGSINLSLKRVNEKQKRDTMEDWRKEQKADRFLEKVADKAGVDVEELYEAVAFPFQKEYDSTFAGFEHAAMEDADFDDLGIDGDLADAVTAVAKDAISLKQVEMEGEMTIEVPGGDAIDAITEALQAGENTDISYVSAPNYSITVWGRNAEDAKNRMDERVDEIRGRIEDAGGTFDFEKK